MPHFVDIWYTNLTLSTCTYLQKKPHVVNCQRKGIPITSEKLIGCEMCFRSSPNIFAVKWQDKRKMYMPFTCPSADFITKEVKVNERGYPNIVLHSKLYCQHGI